MDELMSSARGLCSQIAGIVAIDRRLNRQASGDLNAQSSQAVDLGRIVSEQHNASDSEHFQHAGGDTVVALVIVETKRDVLRRLYLVRPLAIDRCAACCRARARGLLARDKG